MSKKGYGHGFYLAPYYRYSHFELDDYSIQKELDNEKLALTTSREISLHSVGLVIGIE